MNGNVKAPLIRTVTQPPCLLWERGGTVPAAYSKRQQNLRDPRPASSSDSSANTPTGTQRQALLTERLPHRLNRGGEMLVGLFIPPSDVRILPRNHAQFDLIETFAAKEPASR
jgi:hypothetical protein